MEETKKRDAETVLGDEENGQTGNKNKAQNQRPKGIITPDEALRLMKETFKGTLELVVPMRGGGRALGEIDYDLMNLTSAELMEALDSTEQNNNIYLITHRQAMAVFAASAAKLNGGVFDTRDILTRLSGVDGMRAERITKAFWNASCRVVSSNTLNG